MSDEMKLKKEYKDTFHEVKAPKELAQKMLELPNTDCKKKTSFAKKLAAVAAILFSVFVAGNGIVYAATGVSLLEKAKLYENGVLYETNIQVKVDENGDTYYVATFETESGKATMSSGDYTHLTEPKGYFVTTYTTNSLKIVEEDGKYYLMNKSIKVDVTEDLEDGLASGTYEKDENTYGYKVKEIRVKNKKYYNIDVTDMRYHNMEDTTPLT